MKPLKLRLMAASLLLCAAPVFAVAQDMPAGAWAGTWVASDAKSKFPGPPPKVDQVTIQPDGSVAVHVVSSDGKVSDWSYKPQAGKAVPVEGRDNTTVEVIEVSKYRNNHIWTHDGKVTRTHSTLSKDGKIQTFYGAPGTYRAPGSTVAKPFSEVVVYEKQ
ncbi:MAG TPA: WD40 repeat domain-containing protein [Acidobacteriaceae bacterium]|nr:WD40 repeat domain-containing protein [Acidobacteriaceae bacterium]